MDINRTIIIDNYVDEINISDDIFLRRKKLCKVNVNTIKSTIIICVYNNLDKARNCIESVLKNTEQSEYHLLLIDNGSTDDRILKYFESVTYENKTIIRISQNRQLAYPMTKISQYYIGEYIIFLNSDIVVTPNWLTNLIECVNSDSKIGMVVPLSSNTSNYQGYDFPFDDHEEMFEKARKLNVSDKKKWNERLRLISSAPLFRKEVLDILGSIFDPGFFHDFADDDITFRVRRAGYKTILAKDTWVHHDHYTSTASLESINIGRQNFREKYFGIDAWDDVNNFIPEILSQIKPPLDKENCSILGLDVRCGTPILEIKNHLRQYDFFDATCCAVTSEGKYFIDLQTVCGADNVFACSPADASEHFNQEVFDYIIIGENINEYPEPFRIIRHVYSLLKKGGQMFVYLKNNYDIYTFLNVIGHRQVRLTKASLNLTIEQFLEQLLNMDIKAEVAGVIPYTNVPEEYINEVNNRTAAFVQEEWCETAARLTADRFVIKIER